MMETTIGTQKNIVALGAGYGGPRTAVRLETLMQPLLDHRITLVDQNRHHQIITLIHEVAGGRTPAEAVALPFDWLLGLRRIDFHRARGAGLARSAARPPGPPRGLELCSRGRWLYRCRAGRGAGRIIASSRLRLWAI